MSAKYIPKKFSVKIGIALGGGGARGFAHLGVLKALTRAGIECDVVSGTSIGALVGAVYAGGDLEGLEKAANQIGLTDIPMLLSPTLSIKGIFSGKSALEMLSEYIDIELIEELPKKFAAVSVDLRSYEKVIFKKGNLPEAVRASFAIPVLFTPVLNDEQVLVDGGTREPVPVEVCREMGADFVIAVDLFGNTPNIEATNEFDRQLWPAGISNALTYLSSFSAKLPLGNWFERKEKAKIKSPNLIDILEGTLAISQYQITQTRLSEHPPDILIQPQVSHVGLLDFHRGEPIIELGEKAAEDKIPEILAALRRKV